MEHDVRDRVVDFAELWMVKTEIALKRLVGWIGVSRSKYYEWKERYGKVNEHNGRIPRDFWLESWEEEAIIGYAAVHREEGYRRLTYMMLDADVVAVSASSVYRVLKAAEMLRRWNGKASKKGQGFEQPARVHEHWHTDISFINIGGTFFYLCSVLDGYSRYVLHWELRERMKELDVEQVLQRCTEKYPEARPRVISDNGSQYVSKDFKEFIRLSGMTHVRTSVNYPQSNGKEERWHRTVKHECIRRRCPGTVEEGREVMGEYVEYYNTKRLHSAIGYVTPQVKLEGREGIVFAERDRKLEAARERRRLARAAL